MKLIIPKYKELMQNGQIEISTTPFYHPILPLLLNSESARIALPDVRLPEEPVNWPEDVRLQLHLALDQYQKTFGAAPKGLWPSEGSSVTNWCLT